MATAFSTQGATTNPISDAFKQIFTGIVPKANASTTTVAPKTTTPTQDPNAYGGVNYVSPTIPISSRFGSSGLVDYAKPQTTTPTKTTTGLLPTAPKTTTPTTVIPTISSTNPAIQAENVARSGQQTQNESRTQRQVEESGAITEWENAIKSGMAVEEANKRLTDLRMAIAKKYADIDSEAIPLEFQQGRKGALAEQFAAQELAAQQGVANALSNQQQQFTAAQAQANRNLSAQQGAYTGAQTQAQRGLGAQETVLEAGLPGQISPGVGAYNPLTGQNIPSIGSDPFRGGVIQGNVQLGQQYAGMNAAGQAATGIKNSIQQIINQIPLNPSIFSDVNKVIQLLSGRVSDPNYQTLSNYLNEYISTIAPILGFGGDTTNLKTEIAQSMINAQASGQSISTVLDNLESLAQAKLNAIANAGQGGIAPGSSTGGFAEQW